MKKKTHEEYIKQVKDINPNITVLGQYITNGTPILHECECGNKMWNAYPICVLKGGKCDECNPKKLKSYNTIRNYIESKGCILLSKEYKGIDEKLEIQCSCGKTFERSFYYFKNKNRIQCPDCSETEAGMERRFSYEEVKACIEELNYILISDEYVANDKEIIIQDKEGYYYRTRLANFKINGNANKFHKSNPYTIQNIKLWCILNNKPLELMSDKYNNMHNHLQWKCLNNNCGKIINMSLGNITNKNNYGCKYCAESKAEKLIYNLLNDYSICFETQYRFQDCRNKYPLPFDFAVFNDINQRSLKCLIEYDGEFHYKIGRYNKNQDRNIVKFNEVQKRDKIKSDYCRDNQIKLIRIPYWDFDNIEQILESELKCLT